MSHVAHAPSVAVWIALARLYGHEWVERLPKGKAFGSLPELEAAVEGGIGANARPEEPSGGTRAHLTRTSRVRWEVADGGKVSLSVYRPTAGGGSREVIFLSVENDDTAGRIVDIDPVLVQTAAYERRHAIEARKVLRTLATLPETAGGVALRRADIAARMIDAGAA